MADTLLSRLRKRAERLFLLEESGSWGRRRLIRLGRLLYITLREIVQDHLPDRAASLSFTTMVSLIPTVILLFFLFGGRLQEPFDNYKAEILATLETSETSSQKETAGAETDGDAADEPPRSVHDKVEGWLTDVESELKGAQAVSGTITGIALLVLLFAVSSLFRSAERNFSMIWNAGGSRSFFRKLGVYWMMLTLLPLILVAARLVRRPLDESGQYFLSWIVGVSVSFFAFFLVFAYLPNARVRTHSAAIGALVAALGWELGIRAFTLYLKHVAATSIYGALGVVPVFLMFVFYGWCLALICSELTYCLQNFDVLDREVRFFISRQRVTQPVSALLCMESVYRGFGSADGGVTAQTLATEQHAPLTLVEAVLENLEEHDLVVAASTGVITPTRAAEKLPLAEVVELFPYGSGLHVSDDGEPATPLSRFLGGLGERLDEELQRHSFADFGSPGAYKADTPVASEAGSRHPSETG